LNIRCENGDEKELKDVEVDPTVLLKDKVKMEKIY
jgi:hypothetical protein